MNKIPVFETIAHAYGFATSQFLRILGIVWAPLAVSAAVGLMLTPGFVGNHTPINDAEAIRRNAAHFTPFIFVFSLFIRAMIGVGVTELALGKRTGATFVYFSLSAPVWRLIGAWLLFILVMILIYIGLIILTVVVGVLGAIGVKSMALSQSGNVAAVGLLVILCIFLFCGSLIYVMARLTFLIPPVVVNENKIDLARGWELTKGSFWRIFWIGFAIFVPLMIVQFAIVIALYGAEIFRVFLDIMQAAFLRQINEAIVQSRLDQWGLLMRAQALHVWPFMAVTGILIETFGSGLLFGASAFGYRAVTPASRPLNATGPQ